MKTIITHLLFIMAILMVLHSCGTYDVPLGGLY